MSKRESKQRLKRRNPAYRRIMIYINIFFICLIVAFVIYGSMHTFTNKKNYRLEAVSYYQAGEYEAAIESFDRALSCRQWFSDKVDVDMMLYKASCYLELEDYSNALSTYYSIKKSFNEVSYDKEALDYTILLYENVQKFLEGDYISTALVFSDAVKKENYEFALYAAKCYEAQEDYESMKQYLDIYGNHFGMSSYLYYKNATYYILKTDYDTALEYIQEAKSLGDTSYIKDILYAELICYEKKHNYDEAFSLAQSYKEQYPDDKRGIDMYEFLYTRININDRPLSDKFSPDNEQTSQ